MLIPMAITVELFCIPMSLQVVTWLPITAASLPLIFTFELVPPVTFPSFFGFFWNFIVPGSCMWVLSSCFATLSLVAHFLSFIFTSFESLSLSLPMNGWGSGTFAVEFPAGTTMMCVSMPTTLSSSTAICFPSAVTPLLPLSFMFFPFTLISLSAVITVFFFVLMLMASSLFRFAAFSDVNSRFSPLSAVSLRHFMVMSPSSLATSIPFSFVSMHRIFPPAVSILMPSLPSSSMSSRRCLPVCQSQLSALSEAEVSGGLCAWS